MRFDNAAALAAILMLSASGSAFSQETGTSLKDTLAIEEAVVTALKIERSADEIPASINFTTSLDAKKLSSPTISDALRREPGLSKGGDGVWATSINVRGLGENRLVTLIDRNRVETATDLTASLSMLDVNDIDHVEIIKGAQSSIYGSGAIGGIVNVVTKDGHFAETPYFNGSVTANYSSVNNGYGGYLALYGGGKKWYVKVNATRAGAGDIKTPDGYLANSGYRTGNIGAIAAFKPFSGHILKLQFQRNASWDVGIPGGASFSPAATASYKNIGRTMASLNYEIRNLTQSFELLKFKAFYQGITRDVEMLPNAPVPVSGARPTRVTPYGEHNTFGANAECSWKFGSRNTLTAGAEMWRRNIFSDRKKYIDQYAAGAVSAQMIRTETPLPTASYTSAGIYAQDEMRFFSDRLILTFGGRFDVNTVKNEVCHNVETVENVTTGIVNPNPPGKYVTFAAGSRTDPSWSGNAGLLFKAGKMLDLTLNLSRSYRSPALEELFKFIDLSGNKIHFGNPDLRPEKGIGGDIGARFHGENLNFRISAFVNGISDMIVERRTNTDPASVNDTLVLDNASRALLYGFDGEVSYRFARHFSVYAAGAWTIGMETSKEYQWLPLIPPANGHIGISYDNPAILGARVELTAAGARTANQIAEGERATDAYARLDLALHSRIFNFGRCNLQVFGGIENVTDAKYVNFLSTNRGNIVCEPGRNFYIRVNFTF